MGKISLSIRLDSELVKRIDARKTAIKNRSDVIAELLDQAINQSKADDLANNKDLYKTQTRHLRATILTLRLLEQFIKSTGDHGREVCAIAHEKFKEEMAELQI